MDENNFEQLSLWAQKGDLKSSFFLGIIYLYGNKDLDIKRYPQEAYFWLKKAFNQKPKYLAKYPNEVRKIKKTAKNPDDVKSVAFYTSMSMQSKNNRLFWKIMHEKSPAWWD